MHIHTLLALASLGAVHALERCGNSNDVAPADTTVLSEAAIAKRQENTTTKAVDVYFHIASTPANSARLTDEIVAAQFTVLHDTYLAHGFAFTLINTSRVVDETIGRGFYDNSSTIDDYDAYVAYRTATRRGGYDALNVYFVSDLLESLGGQCDLPSVTSSTPGSQGFVTDGCVINGDTMPGLTPKDGSDPVPRLGHIAVHEVGHWFGLLHTWSGRPCDAFNDYVADTPAQAGFSTGCPIGRDSCPDVEGLDPIHNFMDYSSDNCTSEFTPGQEARMHQQFENYRMP